MHITSLQVGPIMTNCYLLCDETAQVCALIDPGDDALRVEQMVAQSGCTLQYILLTHGHFDHTSAVRPLLEKYPDVPVYIHEKDAADTERGELLFRKVGPENQRFYKEGDTLPLGSLTIRVLETPGHTPGSVCLLCENVLFSGDTLFAGSCGRVDLAGGVPAQMGTSLKRLAELPGNYAVLPGHGPATTLDAERADNPYLREVMA